MPKMNSSSLRKTKTTLLKNAATITPADRDRLLQPFLDKETPSPRITTKLAHKLCYKLVHALFGIVLFIIQTLHAVIDRITSIVYYHHRTPGLIRRDVKGLRRLPEHLAVILSLDEDVVMDQVADLATWSCCAGIPALTVYERSGMYPSLSARIYIEVYRADEYDRSSKIMHPRPPRDNRSEILGILWIQNTISDRFCSASSRP